MKTIVSFCLIVAALGAGSVNAEQAVMHVTGSSKLQLVIVDSARPSPSRDAVHEAFAASLSTAMAAICGGPVEVQSKCLNADQAAFALDSGNCHVVLSIGKSLPRPLVRSELERLNATLGAEKNEKKAYLIFSNADEGLTKLLTKSFATAITDTRFLDALDGGIEAAPDPTKTKTLASTGS